MGLTQTIQQDLVTSLKAKDTVAVSALRGLKAALQEMEIAEGSLTEERVFAVVQKQLKQREDSRSTYAEAGRADLAEGEQAEIDVLKKYQPEQLSEDDVRKIIEEVTAVTEDPNFGAVMGQVMGKVKGKADGKMVQTLLKEILNG